MVAWELPNHHLQISRRPLIIGIVNVTPDSFSDGGRFSTTEQAVAHGMSLAGEGADILEIGGESTRPGAESVPAKEELGRVLPVVDELARNLSIPIAIDTSKAEVARACCNKGAAIVNDVTALTGDPDMEGFIRESQAGVVLMHMQGTPRTMQKDPVYDDVVTDIIAWLGKRIETLAHMGVTRERIAIDPGIGFGKTLEHNLQLLSRLNEFGVLGRPLCLGVSRKSFIGKILGRPVEQRLHGSLAVLCHAMSQNAVHLIRVHDVAATRDVIQMWESIA